MSPQAEEEAAMNETTARDGDVGTQRLDYANYDISILVSSRTEQFSRAASCRREPSTIEWIESFGEGTVFFDVGSNTGAYSLVAASLTKTRGYKDLRVVAFEPHFQNFHHLCQNLLNNGFLDVVTPVYTAVGETSGIGKLHHWDEYELGEAGSSGHQLNRTLDYKDEEFTPRLVQSIQMLSLDDFCAMTRVYPTALKIDVDGIELEIIRGARETLSSGRCKKLLVEVNQSDTTVVAYLTELGYRVVKIAENNNHFFEYRP